MAKLKQKNVSVISHDTALKFLEKLVISYRSTRQLVTSGPIQSTQRSADRRYQILNEKAPFRAMIFSSAMRSQSTPMHEHVTPEKNECSWTEEELFYCSLMAWMIDNNNNCLMFVHAIHG